MVTQRPELFWGVVMSFWIGNLILLVLNLPLIGIWVRILSIPYKLLYPAILSFVCIGAYAISNSTFDIFLVLLFGILGYGMRILNFSPAPLLLGFVLGPLIEEHFRRAMLFSRGSFNIFVSSPLSATFLLIALCLLLWSIWGARAARRRSVEVAEAAGHIL